MVKRKNFGRRLVDLFTGGSSGEEFFEELEDMMVEADLGATLAMRLSDELRELRFKDRSDLVSALRARLLPRLVSADLKLDTDKLNIILTLGVNGVGKTTNLAKIGRYLQRQYPQAGIVMAAGDTFRAAAIDQLSRHAEALGIRIVKQNPGADAGAVIFDAVQSAANRGDQFVLVDTAGRMHNRANLIAELEKIDGIVRRLSSGSNYRRLLVLDATTGQNAFRQAEMFQEAVGVDALLLAKYDSTARGGVLVPIVQQLEIGCAYLGVGEKYDDLRVFDPESYLDELLAQ